MPLKLLLFVLVQGFSLSLFSQSENQFHIQANSGLLVLGEWNSTYDFLIGGHIQYLPSTKRKFQPFLQLGAQTNTGPAFANLFNLTFGAGLRFPFSRKKRSRFFLDTSFGLLFWQELLATRLTDQNLMYQHTAFGFYGSLDLHYQLSEKTNLHLYCMQYHDRATSVGLGVSYSF